ncbi:MAG: NUDIX domain-containing protein [Parcubacteria group bacterium]|nr:NUDIX domain-containing protein [Parcubacteria group bacterium]
MDLRVATTENLLKELLTRHDLLDKKSGMMDFHLYQLFCKYGVLPCTDGIAVRRNSLGQVEAMAIRRGTGCFRGRLCSVGGRILRGERMEDCLRRQFRNDLNCEIEMLVSWKSPVDIGQAYPLENPLTDAWPADFGPEDRKHTISCYYPVKLLGEPMPGATTSHGGQEAIMVEWYTLDTLPAPIHFGYDQHPKFVAALTAARALI